MRTILKAGLGLALSVSVTFLAYAEEGVPATTRSTATGVFTQKQAERGAEVYRQSCSDGCHLSSLLGEGKAKPLVGDTFREHWHGKTLAELYGHVSVKMPQDLPGTLSDEEYLSAVVYLLSKNGSPSGETPLPGDSETLATIEIAAAPAGE